MFTIKKLLFLLVLIIFTYSTLAFTLDINQSKLGSERNLAGNILLPSDVYEKESLIKLSIDGNSKEKSLSSLVNCTQNCNKESSSFYSSSGAADTSIIAQNFLTGLRIRKGSSISIDASFNISNSDSNYPDSPSIDVGNDGIIEWGFKGQATNPTTWVNNPFRGPDFISLPEELNIDALGTCQNIFLNASNKFRIKSYLKKSVSSPPSLGVFIRGYETAINSCSALQDAFSEIACDVSTSDPLEDGDYNICLTSPSSGIILGVNSTAKLPYGKRCTSSSCSSTNVDYLIQAQSADFITTLQSEQNFLESNTNQGELLKDSVGNYLQNCNLEDDYCIVPIKISAKNNANVKISSLLYVETLSDSQSYNRNKFLLGVEDKGKKDFYRTSAETKIPLASFGLLTPKSLGSYTLNVEYGLNTLSIPIEVVPAPTAKISISSEISPTSSLITFDASNSSSKDNLTLSYLWSFGDGANSPQKTATHSYLASGTYTVTLTVKDENDISDVDTKTIEIFSETATPELVSNTITQLTTLRDKFLNNDEDVKTVFLSLGFDKEIEAHLSRLSLEPGLSESEVNSMLSSIPTSILIQNKLLVSPFLTSNEINKIYGYETEEYKLTLQEFNSKFESNVDIKQILLSFPKENQNFILIKKTITTPQPISDVSVIEAVPNLLVQTEDSLEFLEAQPEITKLSDYTSAKFTLDSLTNSFSITYKVNSNNFNGAKNTISMIVPKDLSPSLAPFDCGNRVCNPAEDSLSCPEDCSKPESDFPLMNFLIAAILIVLIVLGGWKFKLYKTLKLDKIPSLFAKKSPFHSGSELAKVRNYIIKAQEKGYSKEKITSVLWEQGWTKSQINYAFNKIK